MRTSRALLSLAIALLLAALATAHEGHEHKAMGIVTSVNQTALEIKGSNGEMVTVVLDGDTKYKMGNAQAKSTDIKTNDRVVVSYVEKDGKKLARLVRMGSGTNAASPPPVSPPPASPQASPKP